MKRNLQMVTALFVLALTARSAMAIQAYFEPNPTDGTQAFGGSLGMDFDVNSWILVNQLGVFDDDQNGIAAGTTLTAQLWSRSGNTGVLISPSITFTSADPGTLSDGHRLKDITPLLLGPGSYTIVAFGYNAAEENGNTGTGNVAVSTNSGGGLISFVGGGRFGTAGLFPATPDGGPPGRYHAGTFNFVGVPEPATAALLLLSGLAALRRNRREA
jgi:hypothetical protein